MKNPSSFRVEVVITPLWSAPADTLEESMARWDYAQALSVEENRFRDLIKGVMSMLTERSSNG